MQVVRGGGRRHRVLVADDNQRRHMNRRQQRRRVGPRHERAHGAGDRLGRARQHERPHLLRRRRSRMARRLAEQLRHHLVGNGGRTLVLDELEHARAPGDTLGRVGL